VKCKSISFFTPPTEGTVETSFPYFFDRLKPFFTSYVSRSNKARICFSFFTPSKTKRGTMFNASFLFLFSSAAEKLFCPPLMAN
jgi:hypothetical protein